MGIVDLVILVVFILSIIVGIFRGFIRDSLSIASWIVAFWLARTYDSEVGDYLTQYVDIPAEAFRIAAGFLSKRFAIISRLISSK